MADYKCASVGCYSYQSPEKNQQLLKLQTAINQFSTAAAFEPVKVDGIIGKGTTQAALIVLGYLGEIDPQGLIGASARGLEDQINTPEQLTLGAQAVIDILTLAARQPPAAIASQVLPAAPIPATAQAQPSVAQLVSTTANKAPTATSQAAQLRLNAVALKKSNLSASLFERLPPWASYVGGGLLAAGALAIVITTARKRKTAAAATAPAAVGHWRY
jgi:hypothetical protein